MQNTTMDLKAAKEIRLYDMNSFMIKKYSEINKERYEAQKKKERLSFAADAGYNVIWAFCQIILYGWIIYSAVNRKITVGNLTLYLTSMTTLFNGIIRLLDIANKLFSQSREVEDYRKFIDIEIEEDTSGMAKIEVPEFDEYNFTFRNVSFKYPKSDNYVLYNLNLTVSSGEKLAVVGLNGAGKSTMIKLLLGLYEPTQGVILLNGVDIKKYDRISYYNIFAPVFQEIPIFAFPLIENVSMNTLDNTDIKRAEYAVGLSGLSNKADSLKKGIFTELLKVISDDGVELSGGENQKLGLARAVYKNAPVIVLDEPTASMDALAESRFYRNFDKMMGGKTAIYISHRLSAARFCSKIALFDNGKLAEYGTHESLMAAGGMYSDMFKIQAQYYHEEADLSE
jgi:ATP-binding cassette subfamily B protein